MSATVAQVELGTVAGFPDEHTYGGKVIAGNTVGYPVNMWNLTTNTFLQNFYDIAESDKESLGQIQDVPRSVAVEVDGTLLAGSLVGLEGWPIQYWASVDPIDKFLKTTIRIDVLQMHKSVRLSGDQPTASNPLGDNPPDDPPGLFEWLEIDPVAGFMIVIAVIGILIALGFVLMMFSRLIRGI